MKPFFSIFLACAVALSAPVAWAAALDDALKTIRGVGPEGQGNTTASAAWKTVSETKASSLPTILEAMDGANELALNWLRSAVETIAAKGERLPVSALEKFVNERTHHPRARRLAYELIAGADAKAAQRLMDKMLDDPSTELRRDAVQGVISKANELKSSGNTNETAAQYEVALKAARDLDQIEAVAKALREMKRPVELREVFGWVNRWHIIGPFDNTEGAGYNRVFPPEENVDLKAEYEGKTGKMTWKQVTTLSDYGKVDFNGSIGKLKDVTGYAWAELESDKARPVEVRLGCKNGWKIWLNGKLLFGRDEYHLNTAMDQFKLPAELKAGKNTILVKLCQNAYTADWAKEWEFQLRITDAIGTPIVVQR
jgi:hypothetical protein